MVRIGRTAEATINGRHLAAAASAVAAVLLLLAPGAAAVGPGAPASAFVPQELLDAAAAHPDQIYRVIVQGTPSQPVATVEAGVQQSMTAAPATGDSVNGAFSSIGAVAAELTGEQIELLAADAGIFAITPDQPLRASVFDPPVALEPPTITGSPETGATLIASPGQWSGAGVAYAYQWQRCDATSTCADVTGATATTYNVTAEDVGSTIEAVVTATNADGSATSTSAPTASVASTAAAPQAPLASLVPPSISGTAVVGQTLSTDDGVWSGTSTTVAHRQWQRCDPTGVVCIDSSGATGTHYAVTAFDVSFTVRVVVTASDGSASATAASATSATVAAAPPPPSGSGTGTSGSTGSGSGGTSGGSTTTASAPGPVNVTLPTISGDPTARGTLVASHGIWTTSDDHPGYSYRWQRCDSVTGLCTTVWGGRTYTPLDADVGSTLQVRVTVSDDGNRASATSDPTDRVGPYSASGFFNWQLGPYAAKLDAAWTSVVAASAKPPAIAIVDSGVDPTLPGLAGKFVRQVSLTSLPQSAAADGYGHGSFVAQVAAGNARGNAGAAPTAPIVSLDVMDDNGMALTSDVVAAADWIATHKDEDNIRVANFSLIGSSPSSVMFDPLDRALERLWFSGVVVVTAAGNFAVNGQQSDEPFAPANDPFAITVGASDTAGTVTTADDSAAPWSAYGHTFDGFGKPELGAPARYVVASVPPDSTLYQQRPDRVVGPGRLELSGTSFAAPMVSGIAADLLALHPDWTPDQVKGALMLTAAQPAPATGFALGVGVVDAGAAAAVTDAPNPNAGLEQFLAPDPNGGPTPVFDTASWGTTARADASWGTASWGTASWGTASWGTASWGTTYWSSASWGTASWGTASWGTASWGTASWGTASWGTDNALADLLPGGGYPMSFG